MTIYHHAFLIRFVLATLFLGLVAPDAGAQTAAPATPPIVNSDIPAACRNAGGALVTATVPFTRDRDEQAHPILLSPAGERLSTFPVPGALQLIPTPVKNKVIVLTTTGETWIYDVSRGDARRYGGPTSTRSDYAASAPGAIVAGVYLLVLAADGWEIIDIRSGDARSLTDIAGPQARFLSILRNVVANDGKNVLLSIAVGTSRHDAMADPALAPPQSYPVVVIPGDLRKAQLLDGYVYPDATAFSSDGRELAMLRAAPGAKLVYVRDLASGAERKVDEVGEETKIGALAFGGDGLVLLRDQDVVSRPETVGGTAKPIGRIDGPVTDGMISPSGKQLVFQTAIERDGEWTDHWWRLDLTSLTLRQLDADDAEIVDDWPRGDRWLLLAASASSTRSPAWAFALLDTETGRLTTMPASGITAFGRTGPIAGREDGIVALAPLLADGAARLEIIDGRANRAWSVPLASKDDAPYTLARTAFSPALACAAIATTTVTETQPLHTSLLPMDPGAKPVPLLDGLVIGWLPAAPRS